MKISIPHIHKIEGEAGFFAKVAKTGEIKELKIKTLEGLRQIEGILIGRRVQEVPIVVSRICGICPVVLILNACSAMEKALEIKVSPTTTLLRKLFLASQIIHSHALHLFFLSLPDFLDTSTSLSVNGERSRTIDTSTSLSVNGERSRTIDTSTSLSVNGERSRTIDIENDLDLIKKFKKETKAALKIRDFALEITQIIGGRKVHPVTPDIGGFRRLPDKGKLQNVLKELPATLDSALILAETFKNLSYPELKRETDFVSVFSKKEYGFYREDFIKVEKEKFSIGDFYSNKIEEDLRTTPVKRVKYRGKPYMVGAIARIKNNEQFLSPLAKKFFEKFLNKNNITREDFFDNRFYNLFSQVVEVLHFLETSENLIREILESDLEEARKEFKISKGSGLSAMEAPRGTLFTYFEVDRQGRISNCNIITPTVQFLNNMEEDLKSFLPNILKLSEKEKIRKIRSLIRVYDPCISCATH